MKAMKKVIGISFITLLGAAFGYGVGKVLAGPSSSGSALAGLPGWGFLILLPLSVLLVLAVHELGHVAAGLSQGFDFRMLVVGPFRWEREAGKLRFYWNRHLNAAGGLALCLPRDRERLIPRLIRYIAGGPLASLAYGLACLGIYLLLPKAVSGGAWSAAFLLINGWMSLAIFIVTMVPMHSGGFFSDGARLLRFARGGEAAELDALLMQIVASSTSGTRPRELDEAVLDRGLEVGERLGSPVTPFLHYYKYYYYLDRGAIEAAARHLDHVRAQEAAYPKAYRPIIPLETAFFTAAYLGSAEAAQEWFDRAELNPVIPKVQILIAEAALAKSRADWPQVLAKVETARRELPKVMDAGIAIFWSDWLESLEAQAARTSPVDSLN